MERVPEHDLMDNSQQAEAYSETDFSEPHNAFVSLFKARFPDFSSGEVLDLGCGTADVIIRFARALPDTCITGIDGAQAMLDIGLRDVEINGVAGQIKLRKCLLPDSNLAQYRFDAVISNSLLHHLRDPLIIWNTIKRCAKHRATVFVMDLFRPGSTLIAEELVEKYAADASDILKKDFYNSLLASYTIEEIIQHLNKAGMSYLKTETISDRHVLIWGQMND